MAFVQIRLQILRNYRHTELELFDFDLYSQKAHADQFLASLEPRNRMRMVFFGTDTLTAAHGVSIIDKSRQRISLSK